MVSYRGKRIKVVTNWYGIVLCEYSTHPIHAMSKNLPPYLAPRKWWALSSLCGIDNQHSPYKMNENES